MPTQVVSDTPAFHLEYDYDAAFRMTAVRMANTGTQDVRVTVTRTSDGVSHQHTFLQGQTQVLSISTGAAQRLQLTVRPDGKLDGAIWHIDPL